MTFFKRMCISTLNEIIFLPLILIAVCLIHVILFSGLYFIDESLPMGMFIILGAIQLYIAIFDQSTVSFDPRTLLICFLTMIYLVFAVSLLRCAFNWPAELDLFSRRYTYICIKDTSQNLGYWKVLLRTFVKYLTLFFFPPLFLFPLFNKQRLFLHEMVSGVKKVDKRDV